MAKVVHLADVHLGSFRDDFLRRAEERALSEVLRVVEREGPDLLLICGDLFDSNIPPIPRAAVAADFLRSLKEMMVEVAMIYGSHDFSPTRSAMVEVLAKAGLIKVVDGPMNIKGVYLDGVHGQAGALEVRKFPRRAEPPRDMPSIFAFHSAVAEAVRGKLPMPDEQTLPASSLPRGFTYYAGGHVHKRIEWSFEGRPLNYPGPLSIGHGLDDLQGYLKGEDRGLYIVELEPLSFKYERMRPIEGKYIEVDVNGLGPEEVRRAIEDGLRGVGRDWAVLVKLDGTVAGRRVDVITKLERLRAELKMEGVHLYINDRNLMDIEVPKERPKARIERMLDELAGKYPGKADREFIQQLIDILGQERRPGEKEVEYGERVKKEVLELIEKRGDL